MLSILQYAGCCIWDTPVLITSWIIHIALLLKPVTVSLASLVRFSFRCADRHWYPSESCSWQQQVLAVCELLCLVLELREIYVFRQRKLRPAWYWASQLFKSAVFSYSLYFSYLLYLRWKRLRFYGVAWRIPIVNAAAAISFHLTLLYSCYIIYKARRLKRSPFAARKGLCRRCSHYGGESAAFVVPSPINSSCRLRVERPIILSLVHWIHSRPAWIDKLPGVYRVPLGDMHYFVKCIACIIPIYFTLPLSARLPGQPSIEGFQLRNDDPEHWDYPRPDMRPSKTYADADDLPHESSRYDEESALTLIDLSSARGNMRVSETSARAAAAQNELLSSRSLGPRYLCMLADIENGSVGVKYRVCNVDDWLMQNHTKTIPNYVFISYTRQQFYTQTRVDLETSADTASSLTATAKRDKQVLTNFAVLAARAANLTAFWIDFECVRSENEGQEESDMDDVYRICDVVRAAHSLAIVLGPPLNSKNYNDLAEASHRTEWLLEWGRRMWTVPEALLCPSEHRIAIYSVGSNEPELIAKRNLAGRTWQDADAIRQLIDHYEGSLRLTQVELISIAMECLQRRQTDKRNAGDVAYVLMGLLRLRPKVNKTDSDLQAFARLSLANDSGKILERILCLRDSDPEAPWCSLQDAWNTKPWQVKPLYQVTRIGADDDEAIMIDDAQGTSIDWTSLKAVDFRCNYPLHKFLWGVNRVLPIFALGTLAFWAYAIWVFLPAIGRKSLPESSAAHMMSSLALSVILSIPALQTPFSLSKHFRAKPSTIQARLFGIQGRADLDAVEALMFGFNCGRLGWNRDCPCSQDHDLNDARPEFTLIDTFSGTATLFRASRPPMFAFAGGQEGGALRVLLCSYDNTTDAFVRETVLRTKIAALQHMPRLDPFYFAAATAVFRDEVSPLSSVDSERMDIPDVPEFRCLEG